MGRPQTVLLVPLHKETLSKMAGSFGLVSVSQKG